VAERPATVAAVNMPASAGDDERREEERHAITTIVSSRIANEATTSPMSIRPLGRAKHATTPPDISRTIRLSVAESEELADDERQRATRRGC
jgi:hypothetical protein